MTQQQIVRTVKAVFHGRYERRNAYVLAKNDALPLDGAPRMKNSEKKEVYYYLISVAYFGVAAYLI